MSDGLTDEIPRPAAEPFVVRRAEPGDASALAALMERTFRDTYAGNSDAGALAAHVAEQFGPTQQARELADPSLDTLLVERGGVLAAFAQLRRGRPAPSCVDAARPVEVARFYVDRAWHGRGVAQRLMAACVAAAAPTDALWLLVYRINARAIAFYGKSGFAAVGTHPYRFGHEIHEDTVMLRRLGGGGG